MKIAFGCDPNAADFKQALIKTCVDAGHEILDMGSEDPIYANTAIKVANCVAAQRADKGILVCGTGIGMSIAANKVKGAYAALVSDVYSAERAALSNNANIICLGAFTMGERLAQKLVMEWLSASFDPTSPSAEKIHRIYEYERSAV